MLCKNLARYFNCLSDYTELRFQSNRELDISLINGNLASNEDKNVSGVCARVYKSGSWGFASTASTDPDSVRGIIEKAVTNANFLDSKQKLSRPTFLKNTATVSKDLSTGKSRKSRKEVAPPSALTCRMGYLTSSDAPPLEAR